eukprot:11851714-Alexandrium_andersonii.AAC.1
MADCGLRRIATLTGLGRIADCTLGTLQCKDPKPCLSAESESAVAGLFKVRRALETIDWPDPPASTPTLA